MSSGLDIEDPIELLHYLRQEQRIGLQESPQVRVLGGGVSNRAVWVTRSPQQSWVLKQALAKLRTRADWFSPVERIHREAAGMRWLAEIAPPGSITPLIFEDHTHHILAMEAVPEPHHNWKTLLLAGALEADHIQQFARLLGQIHQASFLRSEQAQAEFADRSFFESLRLEPYYLYAASQQPGAAGFLEQLVSDNRQNLLCIVHGDYSPKNILVYQNRLVLLDHEVIHFGDPTFDLGFAQTHLLAKALHLPPKRSQFLKAVQLFWETYAQTAPLLTHQPDYQARAVRQTLGCLLARVDGRSPLEYLDETERQLQRTLVLEMIQQPPTTVAQLVKQWGQGIQP